MAAKWLGGMGPVLVVAVLGVALSLYAFDTWRKIETAAAENNFKAAASMRLAALGRRVFKPLVDMLLVQGWIEAAGSVGETAFNRFGGQILADVPEIVQLIWAPVDPTRSDPGTALASTGFTTGYVLPSGGDIAGRQTGSLPGYGKCLLTKPEAAATVDRFCILPTNGHLEIFAILPVQPPQRHAGDPLLTGLVAGRIKLELENGPADPFDMEIFDMSAPEQTKLLHSDQRADVQAGSVIAAGGIFRDVRLGGVTWRVGIFPEKKREVSLSPASILVFGGGLAITVNIAGYILQILRRRQRVEILVHDRTRDLETALSGLRLSEQRLRDYVTTASDWYWEAGDDLRFTQVTAQARDHGIEPRDLIGLDRLTEDDAENEVAQRGQTLASHQTFRDLRYDYGGDRDLLTLSLSGVPIFGPDGLFLGYRGSARDITLQLQVDARQRQARWTAEQANRAKSNFLATMSHEIRTPMNGVLGMVQTLRDTALDDEQRRMCDVIYRSGNLLHQILNDILDYSKLEAGKITLESISSSLPDIVESVAELMRGAAEASGLTIEVEMTSGEPPPVMIDPTRLRQVLFNLVSNAIKFSEQGVVSIRLRGVSAGPDRLAITLAISDQGIGISSEAQRRLFTRFSQADSSTTRRYGGTGLGLAITMELVTLMGGTISVFSKPGQGATFIVKMTVPIAEPTTEAPPVPRWSEPPADARILDILVAEDNAINQEVIHGLLRGHRLTMVGDGAQAVEAVQTGRFDLVLMDVMMPILNGLEATAAIRALATPAATVPIIALTANSMSGDRELYLAAGMNDYVSKPIEREKLFEVIQIVTGLAAWRPVSVEALSRPAPVASREAEREVEDFLASLEP